MARTTQTKTVTHVRHVASPYGRARENPPSLGDLREFVRLAEGLPDDLRVFLEKGSLDEGGRHNFVFSVRFEHPE